MFHTRDIFTRVLNRLNHESKEAMKKIFRTLLTGIALVSLLSAQNAAVYKLELPNMTLPRMNGQVVKGYNSNIIAIGGHTYNFVLTKTAAVIQEGVPVWSSMALVDNRDATGIVHLKDSTCLLVGGMSNDLGVGQLATTEKVNPYLVTTTAGPNMINPRTMANGIQLLDGRVLVAGSWYSDAAALQAELINLSTNQVTAAGNLNQPRAYPTLVATNDGNALLFGGWGVYGGEFSGKVEEFNAGTNMFTVVRDQLFTDDPDYRVVSDFGEDMQHRTLPNGKQIFLARKFQNGTGWRLFTVDPATKQFEVWPVILPISDQTSGAVYTYLTPVIDEQRNNLLLVPQLWTDNQGTHHLNFLYNYAPLYSTELKAATSTINLNHWPYYAARTIYHSSQGSSGMIFMGGNISDNFTAVADAFVAVFDDMVGVNDPSGSPASFTLEQNHPNPFNPSTVIRYALPTTGFARISVYNAVGELVKVLVSGEMPAGEHTESFDAGGLPSGLYLYRLETEGSALTRKMLLVK